MIGPRAEWRGICGTEGKSHYAGSKSCRQNGQFLHVILFCLGRVKMFTQQRLINIGTSGGHWVRQLARQPFDVRIGAKQGQASHFE
ncbi:MULTISPECIES: hypothetical protein [Mesorhizobium]|uniref:hypothetical protein n=1 Tax=Mesorhizobium TaxID=68287 RepID=UPI00145A01EB|nr:MULTISPECIES: hypothetical protein [Mesorhizobium]